MATYKELIALANDSDLQDKVKVAVIVAAQAINTDATPPANQAARLIWAAEAMTNPGSASKPMLWAVLAANKSATTQGILTATDESIQTNVDAAVDLFAGS